MCTNGLRTTTETNWLHRKINFLSLYLPRTVRFRVAIGPIPRMLRGTQSYIPWWEARTSWMVNTPSLELAHDTPLKRNSYSGERTLSALQVNVTGVPSIALFLVTLDVRLVFLGLAGEKSIKTISCFKQLLKVRIELGISGRSFFFF